VGKGSALPDLRFKIKLFGFGRLPESREAFRTVPVGLWADPVVTRKFHVASRRINNLRELSGEQVAEPQDSAASDFCTPSTLPGKNALPPTTNITALKGRTHCRWQVAYRFWNPYPFGVRTRPDEVTQHLAAGLLTCFTFYNIKGKRPKFMILRAVRKSGRICHIPCSLFSFR
jgi:hypothetical protein